MKRRFRRQRELAGLRNTGTGLCGSARPHRPHDVTAQRQVQATPPPSSAARANDRNHISEERKMRQPKIIVGRVVVAAAITAGAFSGTLALASPASAALDRYVEVVGCNQPAGQQKCPTVPSVTFDHEGAPGVRIAFTATAVIAPTSSPTSSSMECGSAGSWWDLVRGTAASSSR
jgi:hypothetical protein